ANENWCFQTCPLVQADVAGKNDGEQAEDGENDEKWRDKQIGCKLVPADAPRLWGWNSHLCGFYGHTAPGNFEWIGMCVCVGAQRERREPRWGAAPLQIIVTLLRVVLSFAEFAAHLVGGTLEAIGDADLTAQDGFDAGGQDSAGLDPTASEPDIIYI